MAHDSALVIDGFNLRKISMIPLRLLRIRGPSSHDETIRHTALRNPTAAPPRCQTFPGKGRPFPHAPWLAGIVSFTSPPAKRKRP